MYVMSGSRFAFSGVGTQMMSASAAARLAEVERGVERLLLVGDGFADALARDVLDVALTFGDGVDLALIDVEADDREALLPERQRERQTDIAKTADADDGVLGLDLFQQRRFF